jgi:DNA-directed RNA polymerase subunit RPC12/RpoP
MPRQPIPGQWYTTIMCESCNDRVILSIDLSRGKSQPYQNSHPIVCPECRLEGLYKPEHHQYPELEFSVGSPS